LAPLLAGIQWIVSSQTLVSVKRIGACSLHVLSVIQPDIITLLSTKDSESSANDNTGDNDNCQETSRNTNNSSSAQSKDARLSVSIADLAVVDLSAWNLVHKASVSFCCAEGNITVSLVLINGGGKDGRAISDWEDTSKVVIANIVGARISVSAGNVVVSASNGAIAKIVGANVVVIALHSSISDNVVATGLRIAKIVSAQIVVIAVHWNVLASSCYWIARVC